VQKCACRSVGRCVNLRAGRPRLRLRACVSRLRACGKSARTTHFASRPSSDRRVAAAPTGSRGDTHAARTHARTHARVRAAIHTCLRDVQTWCRSISDPSIHWMYVSAMICASRSRPQRPRESVGSPTSNKLWRPEALSVAVECDPRRRESGRARRRQGERGRRSASASAVAKRVKARGRRRRG
jgi:hypothetical protein